ncbi:MAG: hypothetical protein A2Z12_00645 [Actinobacteria bacterium RBG_16_68_21]|nr:MAG: hypothetical protein A2Z12_00645 [Actinobacteria bacterium RBG_16_68_21]
MNSRCSVLLSVLAGILIAGLILGAIILTTGGEPATTTTPAAATTATSPTTAPITTPSTAATTTTAGSTTTTGATTTTIPFPGDIATKSNPTAEGSPGPTLTDVRAGDHDAFVRVVFDFTGTGTPIYEVGYADPPFAGGGSGAEVPVLGSAFLKVQVMPGIRFDMDSGTLVYLGDTMIDPGFDPIVEIQFIDDFEANMVWVIGLTSERPFTVDVLQDPLRLVIDIAK